MLVEMALLVLIGSAVFLFVLAPLIRSHEASPETEETSESLQADGQPVSDTL